jgi:hypothetical protein
MTTLISSWEGAAEESKEPEALCASVPALHHEAIYPKAYGTPKCAKTEHPKFLTPKPQIRRTPRFLKMPRDSDLSSNWTLVPKTAYIKLSKGWKPVSHGPRSLHT